MDEKLTGDDVEGIVYDKIPDYLAFEEAAKIAYDIVQALAEAGVLDKARVALDD